MGYVLMFIVQCGLGIHCWRTAYRGAQYAARYPEHRGVFLGVSAMLILLSMMSFAFAVDAIASIVYSSRG